MPRSSAPGLLLALAVLLAGFLLALTVGRYPVGFGELFDVVAAKLTGRVSEVPAAAANLILQIRGPRVLAAA
jgi:iron complex transport system permease protein